MVLKSITSKIIESYIPKNFGREYSEIKGSFQYPMFVATALGLKPVFDDWIDADKYDGFVDICKKYDLFVEPDVILFQTKKYKDNIIGGKNITTTYHDARKFSKDESGEVHVFISRSREKALEAKKFGWYPGLIINNRTNNKPFIDYLRFGKLLGYPDCCIDFFRIYNNWYIYNHPYETFKNTLIINKKSIGSYYCNSILMDNTYFFVHHLPCSYRCNKTIELAKKIEDKIDEVEPDFVDKANSILKKPLLVFKEKNFIIFNGTLTKQNSKNYNLSYSSCQYFKNLHRPEEIIDFFDSIESGNNISIENNKLIIKDNNSLIKTIEKKPEWFIIDFD